MSKIDVVDLTAQQAAPKQQSVSPFERLRNALIIEVSQTGYTLGLTPRETVEAVLMAAEDMIFTLGMISKTNPEEVLAMRRRALESSVERYNLVKSHPLMKGLLGSLINKDKK